LYACFFISWYTCVAVKSPLIHIEKQQTKNQKNQKKKQTKSH